MQYPLFILYIAIMQIKGNTLSRSQDSRNGDTESEKNMVEAGERLPQCRGRFGILIPMNKNLKVENSAKTFF